jgi:hypothetical protein
MGDEEEIHLHVTYASHVDMDEAFCARLRNAIEAGLESAPVGVITTPGTQNPKYVRAEPPWPLLSSLRDTDF